MTDTYGALQIPAQVRGASPPAVISPGDPLLGWTADYLKAVLTANALASWQDVAPGAPVVNQVRLHNPEDETFNEKDLPCLFVFRDDSVADQAIEWLADDYRFQPSIVRAWWVMPVATQEKRALRFPFSNAITKVIDQAIERQRDPSWVVAGDPDPLAATRGSVLSRYAGWAVFGLRRARRAKLKIAMSDGPPRGPYEMLALEFYCEELLVRDPTLHPALAGVDATYSIPDEGTGLGPLVVGEQIYT